MAVPIADCSNPARSAVRVVALSLECDALVSSSRCRPSLSVWRDRRTGLGPSFDVSFFAVGSYLCEVDVERLGAQRWPNQVRLTDFLSSGWVDAIISSLLGVRSVSIQGSCTSHWTGHGVCTTSYCNPHVSDSLVSIIALALAKP